MQRGPAFLALILLVACGQPAAAQAPPAAGPALSESAKSMVGSWEFANADRDRRCTVTFRGETGSVGMRLQFDPGCASLFPFVREIVGWSMGENDFLRLLDAAGRSVLDFSEVEAGVYEAPRPGEGIMFIQSTASAAATPVVPVERAPSELAGEWVIQRGAGKPVCALTLSTTAKGPDLELRVRPPCDPMVTRFGPVAWQLDRSDIILKSARGQTWRFEEGEERTWRRIPETADPVLLVRK